MRNLTNSEKPAQETSGDAGESKAGKPLFKLGQCVGTPNAILQLASIGRTPADLIARHVSGNWGNICQDDAAENLEAVKTGRRILSSYDLDCGTVWVITEADRSVTTVLLPSEY